MPFHKAGSPGATHHRESTSEGAVLGGALVTERMMPGAVNQNHGARLDPIVVGELDRGGENNTITPHNLVSKNVTGMAVSGFLVEVERVDLDELMRQYPEAFKRPFHHSAGPSMNSYLYGKKEDPTRER
ncbi:hypothetical protein ACFL0H_15085 [Thermodesulfobacteriota bacterium]